MSAQLLLGQPAKTLVIPQAEPSVSVTARKALLSLTPMLPGVSLSSSDVLVTLQQSSLAIALQPKPVGIVIQPKRMGVALTLVPPTTTTKPKTFSAVAAVSMPAGTPVYVSRANRQLYPADRSTQITSAVVGLLTDDVQAGFVGTYDRNSLVLSDWTLIAGSPLLAFGQNYFLGPNGTLTTDIPIAPGTNTRVGEALDVNTLGIFSPINSILL